MRDQIRWIILEGLSCAGNTSILKELKKTNLIEQAKLSLVKTIEINTDKMQWKKYAKDIIELMN